MGGGNISAAANMTNNGVDIASDHKAETLETLTLAPLVSSYNDMIRPLSDAIETLRCMNITEEITFPKIVVIGDKSSGKTSVIESLTGISLPRGVSTRVPLIIRLQHHRDPRCISQLRLEYKDKSFPINEDRILEETNLATDQIAGTGKAVSDRSLTLVVKKNNIPDLTIVELPGLPVHDNSDCIYKTISGIIEKYIKLEKISLIVNVMSATDDFLTCESIRLLSKHEKTGVRTLHVFTKSDKAFFEDMAAIVTNRGPDYVCVRNQIDNETHNEARAMEANLFNTHHLLSNFDKTIVGIHVLAQKLVLIQLTSISKCLHKLASKINKELKMCIVEQNNSQQHFITISEAMPAFREIIKLSQKSLYKIVVSREYVDYEDDTQMHCHTRLVEMLDDFSKQLKKNHLSKDEKFLADEIQLLKESKSLCPEQVFNLLLKKKIDNIYVITNSFVLRVWDYIESVIVRVLVLHAQNYPQLIRSVKKAAKNVTTIAKERFKGEVFEYLEKNNMEGYTRDPRVISSWNKHKESHSVFHAMRYSDFDIEVVFFDVYVSIRHLITYSEETIKEAIDIKAKMVALLEMVLKMFTDFVKSHLNTMLQEMIENEMETELLNELKSEDENKYKPLLMESPLMTTKRWKIKSRIELLQKLKKVVEDATDEISFHGY